MKNDALKGVPLPPTFYKIAELAENYIIGHKTDMRSQQPLYYGNSVHDAEDSEEVFYGKSGNNGNEIGEESALVVSNAAPSRRPPVPMPSFSPEQMRYLSTTTKADLFKKGLPSSQDTIICYKCGLVGHKSNVCNNVSKESAHYESIEDAENEYEYGYLCDDMEDMVLLATTGAPSDPHILILDSGSFHNITNDELSLSDVHAISPLIVRNADNVSVAIEKEGWSDQWGQMYLSSEFDYCIVSMSLAVNNGAQVKYVSEDDTFIVISAYSSDTHVFKRSENNNLYCRANMDSGMSATAISSDASQGNLKEITSESECDTQEGVKEIRGALQEYDDLSDDESHKFASIHFLDDIMAVHREYYPNPGSEMFMTSSRPIRAEDIYKH